MLLTFSIFLISGNEQELLNFLDFSGLKRKKLLIQRLITTNRHAYHVGS